MKIEVAGKSFDFSKDALKTLNDILGRSDVQPLSSKYVKGEYVDEVDEDGKRFLVAVETTKWE